MASGLAARPNAACVDRAVVPRAGITRQRDGASEWAPAALAAGDKTLLTGGDRAQPGQRLSSTRRFFARCVTTGASGFAAVRSTFLPACAAASRSQ